MLQVAKTVPVADQTCICLSAWLADSDNMLIGFGLVWLCCYTSLHFSLKDQPLHFSTKAQSTDRVMCCCVLNGQMSSKWMIHNRTKSCDWNPWIDRFHSINLEAVTIATHCKETWLLTASSFQCLLYKDLSCPFVLSNWKWVRLA